MSSSRIICFVFVFVILVWAGVYAGINYLPKLPKRPVIYDGGVTFEKENGYVGSVKIVFPSYNSNQYERLDSLEKVRAMKSLLQSMLKDLENAEQGWKEEEEPEPVPEPEEKTVATEPDKNVIHKDQ